MTISLIPIPLQHISTASCSFAKRYLTAVVHPFLTPINWAYLFSSFHLCIHIKGAWSFVFHGPWDNLGKRQKRLFSILSGFIMGTGRYAIMGFTAFHTLHVVEYRHTHITLLLLLLRPSHLGGFLLTLPTLHRSFFMRLKYYQTLCRLHILQPQLPCMS